MSTNLKQPYSPPVAEVRQVAAVSFVCASNDGSIEDIGFTTWDLN